MTLPEAIKTLRDEREWTQRELAAHLRKTETTVRRWELGLRAPSPEVCEKLAALATGAAASCFLEKAGVAAPKAAAGAKDEGGKKSAHGSRGAKSALPEPSSSSAWPVSAKQSATDVETLRLLRGAIQAIVERRAAAAKGGLVREGVADALARLAVDLSRRAGSQEPSASPRKGLDSIAKAAHSVEPGGETLQEKGKVRSALSLQIVPEHERYYRMLERILASHEKGAVASIKATLDTLDRLAKFTDKRLAEEARIVRQARRRA